LVVMGLLAIDTDDRPWIADARCARWRDLPWTADSRPTFDEMRQMAAVCETCPVIVDCAVHGLTQPGGFYAGVWLPWRTSGAENDDTRMIRAAGRRALRKMNESKPRS
jgi:hypothetical protein